MSANPYKVLALKYRPDNFADLIGQDVLVQTLTNAINTNRIANAFLLTGIRGVGKTTTARIIARALNCTGEDGNGSATISPCGVCANCKSIRESRHPDIMEMDAASRTGVDDIREIIENARYLPTSARYKIFIIDEVHMLSKNAFNALLKTLEEPPAHVKFIFATTEIRKIPITILSRCQRFDLRRIDNETLVNHLANIAAKEDAQIEREALEMIANASEGSVRDSLSMLDQAISHAEGAVTAAMTRDMLGLADKTKVIDIFDNIAKGEAAAALDILKELYEASADPVLVLNDLLEYTWLTTKLKVMPKLDMTGLIPQNEYSRAKDMAEKLPMSYLTRCWQMLMKGIGEAKAASNTYNAAEMILVRLAYISDLPSPAAIISNMQKSPQGDMQAAGGNASQSYGSPQGGGSSAALAANPVMQPAYSPDNETVAYINNFNELAELFNVNKEALLHNWLVTDVNLVRFEQGKLEISVSSVTSPDYIKRVSQCLRDWTGKNWVIVTSHTKGQETLQQKREADMLELKNQLAKEPVVAKILEIFPGSYISRFDKK